MLKQNKKKITALLLVSVMFLAACDPNKTRQLAKAEDNIAEAQKALATFLKDGVASGIISDAIVKNTFKPILLVVNSTNAEAITITRDWLTTGETPDKQSQLLLVIKKLGDEIVKLNNAGMLHIKDPAKRALFTGLVVALQGTIASVIIIVVKKG